MGRLSGKCDLYDHLSFEKMVPDKDNPNIMRSDIMECFNIFKERTGGVIYQHKHLKVTPFNQDMISEMCPQFKVIKHQTTKVDKRTKSGTKDEVYYTYMYYDKEYTLKEINKREVYIKVPIYFDTLLELLPYLSYVVACSMCDDKGETIIIDNENFVDKECNYMLKRGINSIGRATHYRKELANLYREVVLAYFNPTGKEHVEMVDFDENFKGKVSKPIDENFKVEWRWKDNKPLSHWTSPKVVDAKNGIIEIDKQDYSLLGNQMLVYYVEYVKPEPNYDI